MTATLETPRSEPAAHPAVAEMPTSESVRAGLVSFLSWAKVPFALWLGARLLIATVWVSAKSYTFGSGIWDSVWYHLVATEGYSLDLPKGMPPGSANIAFFPMYPMVSGFVSDVTGLDSYWSLTIVSLVTGLIATILLWAMVRSLYDERRATAVTALFAFSSGSFALSMLYSEGLFLVAAISCCWLLMRERYLLAGAFAAIGTASRPTGVVLVVVCAVAAWFADRKDRRTAIAATLLSMAGIGGYFVFLRGLTGSWTTYFEVQKSGWQDRTHLVEGRAVEVRALIDPSFGNGAYRLAAVLSVIGFVTIVVALRRLIAERAHVVLIAYTGAMAAMLWTSVMVGYRPRMVMVIFPVFIGLSGVLDTRRRFSAWMIFSVSLSVLVTAVYLTGKHIVP
ncbi:MAG: hypothetical protein GX868_02555 [Actinobacteria bacterium]|nr:hypothetical protein [Actinomycetota bacterium]